MTSDIAAAVEAAANAIVEASFGQDLPEAPIDLARAAVGSAWPILAGRELSAAADEIQRWRNEGDDRCVGWTSRDWRDWLRQRADWERG